MKRSRWVALAVTLVVSVSALAATTISAGAASNSTPTATDVGITATEIHVAVIADVDNPIVPNLFKGSKAAVAFDRAKATLMGARARETIAQRYDIHQTAESWRAAYARCSGWTCRSSPSGASSTAPSRRTRPRDCSRRARRATGDTIRRCTLTLSQVTICSSNRLTNSQVRF